MEPTTTTETPERPQPPWVPAPGLRDVKGDLRVEAGRQLMGVIRIEDGKVFISQESEPGDAALICESREDCVGIMQGRINPVVAFLQGRLSIRGDRVFAIKAIFGLQAGAPLGGAFVKKEG